MYMWQRREQEARKSAESASQSTARRTTHHPAVKTGTECPRRGLDCQQHGRAGPRIHRTDVATPQCKQASCHQRLCPVASSTAWGQQVERIPAWLLLRLRLICLGLLLVKLAPALHRVRVRFNFRQHRTSFGELRKRTAYFAGST